MDQPFAKLFSEELADIYDAEQQILKALPQMIKTASALELQEALEHHRLQTEGQVRRLEQIFRELGEQPKKKCKGMAGLLAEGEENLAEDLEPHVKDAAIIGAAQKVEHYEIPAYGTARTFAAFLGNDSAVELLEQTLEEEKEADMLLTQIAESQVNVEAAAEDEGAEEEIEEMEETESRSTSRERTGRSRPRTGAGNTRATKGGSRSARSKR